LIFVLMMRSVAKQRVSNHEAPGLILRDAAFGGSSG